MLQKEFEIKIHVFIESYEVLTSIRMVINFPFDRKQFTFISIFWALLQFNIEERRFMTVLK